jgi:hypothetical protein
LALLVASFLLGWLLYATVENPMRNADFGLSRATTGAMVASSFALMLVPGLALAASARGPDYREARRANHGFSATCDHRERFVALAECRTSRLPQLLAWGDSFAMHLVPGLAATAEKGVQQATQSGCGPLVGLSQTYRSPQNRAAAESCIGFNASVLDYVAASPSIEVVALSTPLTQYLDDRVWRRSNGRMVDEASRMETALDALRGSIAGLRARGKRVVLVAPPPSVGWDIGRCLQRRAEGKPILGVNPDCKVSIADSQRAQEQVRDFLHRAKQELDVDVVDFDRTLCGATECETTLDGKIVYRDAGHSSHEGSVVVARRMALAGLLMAKAR